MRHNRTVIPANRTLALFPNSKIWVALQGCVLTMSVALTSVLLNGCAGFVNGSTTNPVPAAPTITTEPANQTAVTGQTAIFTVVATGSALSYQWNKNGAAISGGTSSTYTTPPTTGSDNGAQFMVVVSNNAGSVTSTAATLTVNAAVVAPTITSQPANQIVTAGLTATFSVVAAGNAPLSYQWQKNGANIGGATASSYTTAATTTADSGSKFDVVVGNSAGSVTSAVATLTVNAAAIAPTITTQPVNQTVTAGQTASFSVVATGTAPVSYQWNKNGTAISGATSSTYTTPATTSSDSGAQFTVVVSNSAGSVTSTAATLTVNAAAVAPAITTQPVNQVVTVGQTATFTLTATGTAPLSYQWQKNGANIAGATASSYTTAATAIADSGSKFDVVVGNSAGSITSNVVTLTVNPTPVAPAISTQPANQTVTAGQTATFAVVATGAVPLSYQWNKNGTAISGATSSTYTTPATTSSDNRAQFIVVVSNSAGSVTSTAATLTVNAAAVAPAITTQPVSESVAAGQTAAFTVVATGTAPLAYQWQKNGASVAGATSSSYTTPATSPADSGSQFDVVVSNSAGSVTSSSATLSVNSFAISTTSLPTGTVGQAYSAQLNATGGTAPYTWTITSGSLPAGLTLSSSGAISGTPTTVGTGSLTVRVTDASLLTAQQSLSISTTAGTACAPTGSGVCYYVDPTGSDSNSGTSSAPFLTIQHAANVVNPGDMVIVRDGTYNNPALSGVGSKLIVMSRGGTASNHVVFVAEHKWGAKVDGLSNTTATGWEFSANYIDVKDFECYGFSDTCMENYNGASSSGGQFIDIAGNNIHDIGRYCTTTTTGRDGIFISNDNVIIEGNQIHDIGRYAPGENGCTNPAHYQNNDHGIYIDGAFTSANNLTIKNNIFYRNERGWSIQVYPAAVTNLRILNNSFVCGNPYRNGHITLAAPITNSAIENNISWQPTTGFLQYDNTSGYSNLSVANNLTYQGAVGAESAPAGVVLSGNLDNTDPLFVSAPGCTVDDPSVLNAYLQTASPAVDAGLTLSDVPMDYAGTPRPQGIRFDIGAFEYIF